MLLAHLLRSLKAPLVLNFTDVQEMMQMRISVCCEIKAGLGLPYLNVFLSKCKYAWWSLDICHLSDLGNRLCSISK